MVMNEENSSDLRKRQLIRTECFLILANLLDSKTLFGDVKAKIDANGLNTGGIPEVPSSSSSKPAQPPSASPAEATTATSITQPNGRMGRKKKVLVKDADTLTNNRGMFAAKSTTTMRSASAESGLEGPLDTGDLEDTDADGDEHDHERGEAETKGSPVDNRYNRSTASAMIGKINRKMSMKTMEAVTHTSQTDLALLKPLLLRKKKTAGSQKAKRMFRARPSMFYEGTYEKDNIAPGVDPTNWYEQDRRLGYQKSRMWFPVAGIGVNGPMMPAPRAAAIQPDAVVQEYLQMKALLSYVGDIIMPYDGNRKRADDEDEESVDESVSEATDKLSSNLKVVAKLTKKKRHLQSSTTDRVTGGVASRLEGKVSLDKYEEALKEAVAVWTPLMGAYIPAWAKPDNRSSDMRALEAREQERLEAIRRDPGSIEAHETLALAKRYNVKQMLPPSVVTAVENSTHMHTGHSQLDKIPPPPQNLERSVLFPKGILRKLLRRELQSVGKTKKSLQE
jgi:hypothetical protein